MDKYFESRNGFERYAILLVLIIWECIDILHVSSHHPNFDPVTLDT